MPDTEQDTIPTKTIIIDRQSNVGVDAEVRFGINGVTQSAPVGVPFEAREDLLEALDNSDRTYTVVDTGGEPAGADPAGVSLAAATGDAMNAGDSQQAGTGSRDGANDSGPAPHVDKDTTGHTYAPDPGAFGATGHEGEAGVPEAPLTAKEQGERNGTSGGSDELGGEMDKAQLGENVIQDGEVKKRADLDKAETSATEEPRDADATDAGSSTTNDSKAFDAEAVIAGNVPDVEKRLDGLTAEQLDAVEAAEQDREQPRAGVAHAINKARAKLA